MMPLVQHPGSWLRIPSLPPGWDGMHPWVVHCPLALFLTAPVFVFLAMILFHRGRWMSLTALILLGLGLFGASLSQSSGLAARDYLHQSSQTLSDEAAQVLQKHEQLGSTIVPIYGILFVVYLVLFLLSLAVRPFDNPVWMFFGNLIFLILLMLAGLVLVNTGELGGRLVHEFGIQGRIRELPPAPAKPTPPSEKGPAPEQKPTPPKEKSTEEKPAEEKPAPTEQKPAVPTEKPKSPEEKTTPAEQKTPSTEPAEKPQPSTPTEKPKEKPAEEKTPEPKSTEEKPPEQKPPEQKPPEQKPPEQKPPEQKPSEQKPSEEKPSEEKPGAAVEEKPSVTPTGKSAEEAKEKPSEKQPSGAKEEKPSEKDEKPTAPNEEKASASA